MSATGRSDVRREGDRYMTPERLAAFLVHELEIDAAAVRGPLRVLEPHAGHGAWVRAVRREFPGAHITANDVIDDVSRWYELGADDARVGDFLRMPADEGFDLIIGNPPYAVAEAHVRHALKLAHRPGAVVAFLLRLGFLESQDRIAFWREHPAAHVYALSERPSFTGGSTDASAYGFFTWRIGHRGPTTLDIVSWK